MRISVQNVMMGDRLPDHGVTAAGDAEIIRSGSLMGGVSIHVEEGGWHKWDDRLTMVTVERETGLDFDATYTVDGMPGVAWRIIEHPMLEVECQGHPDDGDFDGPMGETFYCDGSCEGDPVDEDKVVAIMVGDDRRHVIDVDELTPIDEDDFCHGCGQVGCGH